MGDVFEVVAAKAAIDKAVAEKAPGAVLAFFRKDGSIVAEIPDLSKLA